MRIRSLLGVLAALVATAGLVACGGGSPVPGSAGAPAKHYSIVKAEAECPQATGGRGAMGACAPHRVGLGAPSSPTLGVGGLPTYVDLSNNDPCVCGREIRAAGHVGLIVKANQGTGFIDSTAVGMVASARAAGLAVGEYDFDQDYTVAEARTFVSRLHAAGIWPWSRNTFPAILDVEYGAFSLSGLRAQIKYLWSQGYRVGVYTGGWYWTPHAGCVWVGLPAWLAGYPNASAFCGLASYLFHDHQFTEHGFVGAGRTGDESVHFGSNFYVYVNAAPRPHPKPVPTRRQRLAKALRLRHVLRTLLTRHRCRPPLHAVPRSYHTICGRWLREGVAVNREIRSLGGH